jgi:lysophospholipase L1-like esterase
MKAKGWIIGALALCVLVSSCGFMASVPWIRSATYNSVVNLGDSIFALSGKESDYLHALAGGKTFRRYATSGAEVMGGDWIAPSVYNQFKTAKSDGYIRTVFMDGGGNDILIPATALDPYNCKVDWWESGLSTTCKNLINDVYVETVNTLNYMKSQGVQNVVYQGYYRVKFGWIGTTALNPAVDYGNVKLAQAVANSTFPSTNKVYINPTPYITNSDIISDGIHPSDSGSQKLANLLWPKLKPFL